MFCGGGLGLAPAPAGRPRNTTAAPASRIVVADRNVLTSSPLPCGCAVIQAGLPRRLRQPDRVAEVRVPLQEGESRHLARPGARVAQDVQTVPQIDDVDDAVLNDRE